MQTFTSLQEFWDYINEQKLMIPILVISREPTHISQLTVIPISRNLIRISSDNGECYTLDRDSTVAMSGFHWTVMDQFEGFVDKNNNCACDLFNVLLPLGCQCGGK